jgi:hypothetical protein
LHPPWHLLCHDFQGVEGVMMEVMSPSRMLRSTQEPVMISGSFLAAWEKYVCEMINVFAIVFSASGGGEYFIIGGFNFQGENPKSDLRWIYLVPSDGYLFVSLSKAWSSSG